jgi:adenylate cyclase class 2
MGQEIEAKIKVEDLQAVRNRLQAARAIRKAKYLETNTFFDTPDRSLQSADRGLRIRVAVDEQNRSRCIVTMKGPLQRGQFKTREEIEFTASDAEAVRTIFENMGYHTSLSFEKRRESWSLGDCEVDLDELPYLGNFVEIEGKSDVAIAAVRDSLGLAGLPSITSGYISMLSRYLQEHQIQDRVIKL